MNRKLNKNINRRIKWHWIININWSEQLKLKLMYIGRDVYKQVFSIIVYAENAVLGIGKLMDQTWPDVYFCTILEIRMDLTFFNSWKNHKKNTISCHLKIMWNLNFNVINNIGLEYSPTLCSYIANGCFYTTSPGLGSCDQGSVSSKLKIFTFMPLGKKFAHSWATFKWITSSHVSSKRNKNHHTVREEIYNTCIWQCICTFNLIV